MLGTNPMSTIDHLFDEISALPPHEQVALVERVITAMSPRPSVLDEEWMAEINRRKAALAAGTMGTTDWETCRQRVQKKYANDA